MASSHSREALSRLSKDELIELALGAGGGLEKRAAPAPTPVGAREAAAPAPPSKKQKRQQERKFDMGRHCQRHVALRVAYVGTAYQGFAWQDTTADTVEGRLLEALVKTCLIADRKNCDLSRGGRTDKGVSALGQVVALRLRSNLTCGDGILPPTDPAAAAKLAEAAAAKGASSSETVEIDYVRIINRVLPEDIRVVAWQPVPAHFSARFSATHRTYKYFFTQSGRDIERMAEAARSLVGEHDFRNLCKIDPTITNFRRTILSVDLQPVPGFRGAAPAEVATPLVDGLPPATEPQAVWELTVSGYAFLWHQVRCMVAILFLVGERKEAPSIVRELLDIERYPARPQYEMASDAPLLLYSIGYEDVAWVHSPAALASISELWGEAQRAATLRAAMYHSMRSSLLGCAVPNPCAGEPAAREADDDAAGSAPPAGPAGAAAARDSANEAMDAVTFVGRPVPGSSALESASSDPFVPWSALAALVAQGDEGLAHAAASGGRKGDGPPPYVPLAQRQQGGTVAQKTKGRAK